MLRPAERTYRGSVTDPARWQHYNPRGGDVIVCTPAKAGTTWTQSIVTMLLLGTTDLPDRLTRISPWIEASFSPEEDIFPPFEAQTHRRVLKSHTPADGIPVWEGVRFISVCRHPLEILLSLRKHIANRVDLDDHPMKAPIADTLSYFLATRFAPDQVDDDNLEAVTEHARRARSDRWPDAIHLHYSDMKRDLAGTVALLNERLGTGHSDAFVAEVAAATDFGAMKSKAETFVPEGGKGLWKDEAAFFASGRSGGWQARFTPDQVADFEARLAELVPEPDLRRWIVEGGEE
jgi:hypothetical protein